jgi:hypothetical protein
VFKERLKSIWDVFSRRNPQNVATYKPDEISERARSRILLFFRDVYSGRWVDMGWGSSPGDHSFEFWDEMHNSLEHLYGRPRLCPGGSAANTVDDARLFAHTCKSPEFFDFLELTFKVDATWRVLSDENNLIDAINEILKIENDPYQLTPIVKREEERPKLGPLPSGKTIRTVAWPKVVRNDEEVTHAEGISPALSVLTAPEYEAANLEFRDALDEYRKGVYGDCVAKCGSSFESVLKVLCSKKGWSFSPNDTAAALLKTVLSHTNLEPFFKQPLILIATMRNELSAAHGGGTGVRSVGRHVAQYAITSTAAAIVLLLHEVGS